MQAAQTPFLSAKEDARFNKLFSGQTTSNIRQCSSTGRKFVSLMQLTIGFLSLLCSVLVFTIVLPRSPTGGCADLHKSAVEVWCRVIYVLTAVIGVYSTKKEVLVTVYLAFCIITCVVSAAGVCIASFTLPRDCYIEDELTTVKTIYSVLVVIYGVGLIASVVGANLTCNGLECFKQAPTVIHYHTDDSTEGRPGNRGISQNYGSPFNSEEAYNELGPYYFEPIGTSSDKTDNSGGELEDGMNPPRLYERCRAVQQRQYDDAICTEP